MGSKIKIAIASAALFGAISGIASAAVPTFDVGLNPKMDILLCMIANLHAKEYGPPPAGACPESGSIVDSIDDFLPGGDSSDGEFDFDDLSGVDWDGDGAGDGFDFDLDSDGFFDGFDSDGDGEFDSFDVDGDGAADSPSFLDSLRSYLPSIDSLIGRASSLLGGCNSLDCMTRKMAEMAQGFLQQQILNWIRTGAVSNAGVMGRPLFVRDWDRYLLDAANYASSIFLQELQMTPLCEPFGSELKRIFGTGGGFSVGALSGGGFGGGISAGSGGSPPFNQVLNCNLNSVTRNYQPFFDDFEEGGGWDAWLDLSKPNVNPYSQYLIIAGEKEIREARAAQAARLEAESGDGFLGDKQCVERTITLPPTDEDEGGDVTYQDCPIVTPGIIQKEVTAKVAVSEQEKLQDVHEMKELFDTILRQMVQSILFSAGGLFSGSFSAPPASPPTGSGGSTGPGGAGNLTPGQSSAVSRCVGASPSTTVSWNGNSFASNYDVTLNITRQADSANVLSQNALTNYVPGTIGSFTWTGGVSNTAYTYTLSNAFLGVSVGSGSFNTPTCQ